MIAGPPRPSRARRARGHRGRPPRRDPRQASRARKSRAISGDLRRRIIDLYDVRVAPRQVPDLAPAAADYTTHCAVCHGADRPRRRARRQGSDPAAGRSHRRAPAWAQHSVFGLYNTITLGIKGTAMTGFAPLAESQRWALAFYVSTLATAGRARDRGARSSGSAAPDESEPARSARAGDGDAAGRGGPRGRRRRRGAGVSPQRARPRSPPVRESPLDLSARAARGEPRRLPAGRRGAGAPARGHELPRGLRAGGGASSTRWTAGSATGSRAQMLRYRDPDPVARAAARDGRGGGARDPVAARHRAPARSTRPASRRRPPSRSALVILLREGLEAILVRGRPRRDADQVGPPRCAALRARRLDRGAGAGRAHLGRRLLRGHDQRRHREVTEGVTALVAAAMLLYVGFWMHATPTRRAGRPISRRSVQAALLGPHALGPGRASRSWPCTARSSRPCCSTRRSGSRPALGAPACAGRASPPPPWALGLLAWLILSGGLRAAARLVLRRRARCCMAVLAVVLAGKGIAALQHAGRLPVEPARPARRSPRSACTRRGRACSPSSCWCC